MKKTENGYSLSTNFITKSNATKQINPTNIQRDPLYSFL